MAARETGPLGLDGLARAYFPKAAQIIAMPWALAAGRDLAYPHTTGQRSADLEESTQYFADVDALTAEDIEVQRLVVEVLNLAKPQSALQEEPLRSRAGAQRLRHEGKPALGLGR